MSRKLARPLFVMAAVAGALFGMAGGAHADVRHPATGACTVQISVAQKDIVTYRTYAKYCEG